MDRKSGVDDRAETLLLQLERTIAELRNHLSGQKRRPEPRPEPPSKAIDEVLETVAKRFGLTVDDLLGQNRTQNVVLARQIAMYLCRELTDASLPKIGQALGGRDHTTVIHATSKITRFIQKDQSFYELICELRQSVESARRLIVVRQ